MKLLNSLKETLTKANTSDNIDFSCLVRNKSTCLQPTRMRANAQRDGHPAEYRWHPLFNTTKFR